MARRNTSPLASATVGALHVSAGLRPAPAKGESYICESRPWPRWLVLLVLGALAIAFYQRILSLGGSITSHGDPFLLLGLGVTLVAAVAAWVVWRSPAASARSARWIELGIILLVGLAFRLVFIAAPPAISQDAYRYVWDAHLVSHGISPYTHALSDPALTPLRDAVIWPQVNWRNSPTIYPPGAEVFYLLVNAIAPLNIYAMKLAIEACDVLTGVLTLLLLHRHQLDLRRVLLYWWNPIPVIEFAYSGHVDALAILLTLAALLLALQRWRGARTLAGVFLGLAVLTKLYPLLFVVALIRRRDWGFLAGLLGTMVLLYLPFLRLGLGSGGFLTTYFSQRFLDEGILFRAITTLFVNSRLQLALQVLALLAFCSLVFWLRLRRELRPEAGMLALSVAWIVVSPHLFPWYVAGVLPLLALYLRLPPLRIRGIYRGGNGERRGISGRAREDFAYFVAHAIPLGTTDLAGANAMPAVALWLFVLAMPFTYVIFTPGHDANIFLAFFAVPLALVCGSLVLRRLRALRATQRQPELSTPSSAALPAQPAKLKE